MINTTNMTAEQKQTLKDLQKHFGVSPAMLLGMAYIYRFERTEGVIPTPRNREIAKQLTTILSSNSQNRN